MSKRDSLTSSMKQRYRKSTIGLRVETMERKSSQRKYFYRLREMELIKCKSFVFVVYTAIGDSRYLRIGIILYLML